MESFSRGQPLAWHTKVVHNDPGCLKTGSMGVEELDCSNDEMSSKPNSGRDISEDLRSRVTTCESKRCMTCAHMVVGDAFVSNVNGRTYNIKGNSRVLDCSSSRNVIYLISCRKCGIQYIGKTSQTLRSRLNNHRNRLKQLCNLYLYNHFNSNNHTADDIRIMPIEEVCLDPEDNITLASKLLKKEDFWMRELCSIYPYDNVKGLGNAYRSR